jgi:hypothetical protein
MIAIDSPNPTDPRSALADWLELQAMFNAGGFSTGASLLQVLDVLEDPAAAPIPADPDTGEILDEAILEGERTRFVDIAFEEVHYRQKILNESYPFIVDLKHSRLIFVNGDASRNPGQIVYLFCLLASGIRERRFAPNEWLRDAEKNIANSFQICACLAAGGYLRGEVSSFGFPRSTGTGFLPALRDTYRRFGAGTVRNTDDIPEGLPTSLKDGGIDIVGWLDHPDQLPGKLYLLGQCASGLNWRDKSVVEYIPQLHGSWFTLAPAKNHSPAMFIPFPVHYDLDEPRQGPFLNKLKNKIWHEEQRFGIIFDRLRIAHFANVCMRLDEQSRGKIDGADRLNEVEAWVRTTCETAVQVTTLE